MLQNIWGNMLLDKFNQCKLLISATWDIKSSNHNFLKDFKMFTMTALSLFSIFKDSPSHLPLYVPLQCCTLLYPKVVVRQKFCHELVTTVAHQQQIVVFYGANSILQILMYASVWF